MGIDSSSVSTDARDCIYNGRMTSHLSRNVFFCCYRYDVTDILSGSRHIISHYVNSHISTQHRVLLLLELLFVREGVFSCPPLLSANDIDMFVDFIIMHFLMQINK